jgi:G3E family GTPase
LTSANDTLHALAPVPVTIVTGFLGSGKTTLLNRLLRDPALAKAVVLINEFGEIGLDHLLIEKIDNEMVLMSSGCLCCTIRGDLVDSLENLLRRRDNGRLRDFDRVIIETTGLADPAPVLQTIMSHPYLLMRFRLDGVVTVIDALNGLGTLEVYPEAVKQAAVADRLAISKTDLIQSKDQRQALTDLRARLTSLNPTARLLENVESLDVAHLLDVGLYNPLTKTPDVARWLNAERLITPAAVAAQDAGVANGHGHAHGGVGDHTHSHHSHVHSASDVNRHGASIRAFCLVSEAPLPLSACDLFLEMLRLAHGPNLLRVKGIIALADDFSRPLVIHGVQHIFHPPVRLGAWPDADHRTRIVFIVKDLNPLFLEGLYAAFASQVRIDGADAQALTTNPLKPSFGGLLS